MSARQGIHAAAAVCMALIAHGHGPVHDFVTHRADQVRIHRLLDEQVRVKTDHS